jgi:hypothetical protein
MQQLENNAKESEKDHIKTTFICCFCKRTVSEWLRNDFLQRKNVSCQNRRVIAY